MENIDYILKQLGYANISPFLLSKKFYYELLNKLNALQKMLYKVEKNCEQYG